VLVCASSHCSPVIGGMSSSLGATGQRLLQVPPTIIIMESSDSVSVATYNECFWAACCLWLHICI
jgi:hypothetical protein